ncbi:leucyl/phenylalanyl-tRNA--protein transferase [Halieaceae bacterium IMCC14734]|uniref:Leucyl/phenylalanyl-tRNA--protein transferase n=1 Tax=Candidatus Litorirhabdus singularis TaxID=2518993 RepID=A0ABT3TIL1_9GAMM|nr:leucyl/phenylalanyl-tRNA--protein transferase [Candidatus Litorirhabdus singularis]MCX2981239.1 leucyl/phenylalanyl-tRNA--protein transferase [Candidatus Litorirhabdus singularis]
MVRVKRIDRDSLDFPATAEALNYPNGLLAVGGDLSRQRLVNAYRQGIFPWYEDPQPIMWWSPDPRSVLFPNEMKISRSLRKAMRSSDFRITTDRAFHQVISHCAGPRQESSTTWITNAMGRAYMELHREGFAHSFEVWDAQDTLVGGFYGVALGRVFFGESMFSLASNASKMALTAAVKFMTTLGVEIIDCQVESDHLNSLGARNISRMEFEEFLSESTVNAGVATEVWRLDVQAREVV